MSTKYILQPDGDILKYTDEDGTEAENPEPLDLASDNTQKTLYKDILGEAFISEHPASDEALSLIDRAFPWGEENKIEQDNNDKYTYESESDPSFGFDLTSTNNDSNNKQQTTYKQFSSFANDDMSNPEPFADEFEILTGYRAPRPLNRDLHSFLLSYFVSSIVRFLLVELIVNLNHLVMRLTKGYQARAAERYSLRLGKYDYTEFDVFTKYVYNVLNYPHDSSTTAERLIAYFVGFNEWCAPNSVIDLRELTREFTQSKNDLDFITTSITSLGGINKDLTPLISELAVVGYTVLSTLIESLFNETYNNRLKLLSRKFFQEKYWNDVLLYKAKEGESWADTGLTDLNYYYFKFFIERVQVGLKITKKYLYDDTYLKSGTKAGPFNRVSAHRSRHVVTTSILEHKVSDNNILYDWSSKHLAPKSTISSQTTSIRSLPQLLTKHEELNYALRENGIRRIIKDKSINQNFYRNSKKRIPSSIVEEVENVLEAEYMPFYFHDVRTNEILSFHAFIESITDSFNPEYNSSSGFGRIDDVRSYIKTTRNINLTFTIAATSSSDHDLMWYQVNKIVSMVYPQWSDGYSAKNTGDGPDFKYPFTQVPTASPLIRLRVGDVIKSNYSRTNLSRLHGIGGNTKQDIKNANTPKSKEPSIENFELSAGVYRVDTDYTFNNGVKTIRLDHSVKIYNTQKVTKEKGKEFISVAIDNPYDSMGGGVPIIEKLLPARNEQIFVIADVNAIISEDPEINFNQWLKDNIPVSVTEEQKKIMDPDVTPAGVNEDFPSTNNPITRSYESGMSRGLAGFITQLDVNYNEVNWDTTRIGSKAPMLVKITINFAPIHDIPPGLDHNGMMRAPVYNVGRLNNEFFGDPHDKEYVGHGRDRAIEKYKHLLNLYNKNI